MRYLMKPTNLYAVLTIVLLALSGCTQVKLVADYDEAVLADTFDLAKRVDMFWANYLAATGEDRKYAAVKQEIIGIEVELNSLLLKNEARDENELTTEQIEKVIDVWARSTGLIKSQDGISNTSARAFRLQLSDAFKYVVTGEEAKNISSNVTE